MRQITKCKFDDVLRNILKSKGYTEREIDAIVTGKEKVQFD